MAKNTSGGSTILSFQVPSNKIATVILTEEVTNMLFPGEQIKIDKHIEGIKNFSDKDISEKYINGDIRIITEQARYPLDSIHKMKDVKLELGPEYQRRGRWNNAKKSRLIESFIMNIPVPPVFLYEYELAHFEVMDGKQRLSTIRDFYTNKFELSDLEYWPELNGRRYSQLPDIVKSGIDRRYISAIILLYETAQNNYFKSRQLKQLVFERINTGGIELSHQESRNALYRGSMNDLCIKLSENKNFMQMWGIIKGNEDESPSENYMDMTNVELVLRFFAMRQRENFSDINLRNYLDLYLRAANKFDKTVINNLEELFISTMNILFEIFGEKAFCSFRKTGEKINASSRPSLLIYEPLSYVFSKYYKQHHELLQIKDKVKIKIHQSIIDNSDKFKGRLSNTNYIFERIEILDKSLAEVLR